VIRRPPAASQPRSRSLTIKAGQTHVQRYLRPLLGRIQAGELDASFVISHDVALESREEGPSYLGAAASLGGA
jgi:threonine dehydrogenase-like Zn-dependent dehydrogenase